MNYENGKLKHHTQPKWFQSLIAPVISFYHGGMDL